MPNQLLKILPRLLLAQQHDNRLLRPKRRLEQIIKLEDPIQPLMREPLKHPPRPEIPQPRRAVHGVQPQRAGHGRVARRVRLLHEPRLLAARAHPTETREREQNLVHDDLARKGEEHGVEGHERKVPRALAVHVVAAKGVGQEEQRVRDARRGRVGRVRRQDRQDNRQRQRPGAAGQEPHDGLG